MDGHLACIGATRKRIEILRIAKILLNWISEKQVVRMGTG
jgi:hypothetical protein